MTDSNPDLTKLLEAFNKVMEAVDYIKREEKNKFQNYTYVDEKGLLAKLRPAMVENGLILFASVEGQPILTSVKTSTGKDTNQAEVIISYTLAHVSGAVWPEKIRMAGVAQDSGDKAVYQAITGANKYALFKLFQIATGDDPENPKSEEVNNNTGAKKGASQNTQQRATPPATAPKGIPSPHFTNIFTKIDTAANEGKLTEEWWKAESPKWRKEATPSQWNALVGKMKEMTAKVPDLPPKLLDTLEVAFGAEGEKALRTEAAKIIEADKSLKEAVEASAVEIIRRGIL